MSVEAATPHNAVTYSKVRPAAVRRQITRLPWTPEEDAKVLKMREEGYPWEDIHASLSHQSKRTIQEWYVTCRYQHLIRSYVTILSLCAPPSSFPPPFPLFIVPTALHLQGRTLILRSQILILHSRNFFLQSRNLVPPHPILSLHS